MSRRFLVTILTVLIILIATGLAILYTKGYRFSSNTGTLAGTGILSVKTVPDQVSIYLDGHPYTATNNSVTNINSLLPKKYDLKISKEGFIPWEKEVEVKEGLITLVKVVLFRSTPSIYALTDLGVEKAISSSDGQKIAYIVPLQNSQDPITVKKSGIWVWQIGDKGIPFGRTSDPRQIALSTAGSDLTAADLQFSPDAQLLLVKLPDRVLLLDTNKLNDPPNDVTLTYQNTIKTWQEQTLAQDRAKLQKKIKDLTVRQEASSSSDVKWSPDDTRVVYCENCSQPTQQVTGNLKTNQPVLKATYKVYDSVGNKTYQLPEADSYTWLNDSSHLVITEVEPQPSSTPNQLEATSSAKTVRQLPSGKISVIDYDGSNKAEIYPGNFDPQALFVWPDDSHIIIISSFQTATASQPNFYGVNLR